MAAVLLVPSLYASFDGTITLTQGPYSYGNGGEFTAQTSGLGTFQTFCIEYNEEFQPGSLYNYYQNTGAVMGGAGVDAIDPHTGRSMDNISIGTAWLYSQFRAGTLSGYDFANTYGDRNADAGALQQAIWWLEDEPNGVKNSFVTEAETALTLTDSTIIGDSGGAYGVIALNLYSTTQVGDNQQVTIDGTTYYASQDQLAIVPEPATIMSGVLLLLPFGASTLRILRRKQAA